jgi:uncharacterized membrane protein
MRHFRHHARFYLSGCVGIAAWSVLARLEPWSLRLVVAGDGFFLVYLVATAIFALGDSPAEMRRAASYEDEGITVIFVIVNAAVGLSLFAIFSLVNTSDAPRLARVATLISIPLGWLTLHTVAAFRYAHLYYAPADPEQAGRRDARGLDFPKTEEPAATDFLYFALVMGMTSQTSDVAIVTTGMRRVATMHGVVSFFFNTGLLALAVNIAASYANSGH